MDYYVPAIERAILVLNHLRELAPDDKRSLSEICQALRLPRSSAINILRTLEKHRFVRSDPENGKYSLGGRWWRLGRGPRKRDAATESFSGLFSHNCKEIPGPRALSYDSSTARLLFVDKSEGAREPRATISLGQADPLDAGAPRQGLSRIFVSC